MADESLDNAVEGASDTALDPRAAYPPIRPDAPWSQVWQLPALAIGLGLFAIGVWVILPRNDPPDFGARLDNVAKYLEADNLESARERLEDIQNDITADDFAYRGRMNAYFGDLGYLEMHKKDVEFVKKDDLVSVGQSVVQFYRSAEDEYGYSLSPLQLTRLAQTLIDLERDEAALRVVERLQDKASAEDRYRLIRRLIERHAVAPKGSSGNKLAGFIERFKEEVRGEGDSGLRRKAQIWVTGLEARLRLDSDPGWAADFLNKHIMLLQRGGHRNDLAPLYVLLAKAYHAQDDFETAERIYEDAGSRLVPSDGLNAEILVGRGKIRLSRGPASDETAEEAMHLALHLFKTAVDEYPSEPAFIDALIGQADVESRIGQYEQSREHFGQAVEELLKSAPAWDARYQAMANAVLAHATQASEEGDYERALVLLTTLEPLYQPQLPADMLMRFAIVHQQIANDYLASTPGTEYRTLSPRSARIANQEAAIHFGKSASYFSAFADLITIARDQEHGDALWQSALNYDRAQMWDDAVGVYREFVKTRLEDDRRVEAKYRLARSYLAAQDYASAIEHFKQLIAEHPNGRWAQESLVPLAQAYAASEQLAKARTTLSKATSDHPAITPDSEIYRDALIELGKLHYQAGRTEPASYVSAIETLTECVERYGNSDDGPVLRYLLADSNRLSVESLDEKLDQQRAQRELIALQAERLRRLEEAQIYYNQVITELEDRGVEQLSALEQTFLRNAYFYQADCAYDRSRFEQAIDLYDEAATRWEHHPASLVGYVQIVNAHCELGQYSEARKANAKALWALERLPDEAFDDPTLPMSRQHWEDWLRWTSELDVFGQQASAN